MTATLDKLLADHKLHLVFEEKKEDMVFAVWNFIDAFISINGTEPPRESLQIFIHQSIKYLPTVSSFYTTCDTPIETKKEVIGYLVDKFYDYAVKRLAELDRGGLERTNQNP